MTMNRNSNNLVSTRESPIVTDLNVLSQEKDMLLTTLNNKFRELAGKGYLDEGTIQSVLSNNASIVDQFMRSSYPMIPTIPVAQYEDKDLTANQGVDYEASEFTEGADDSVVPAILKTNGRPTRDYNPPREYGSQDGDVRDMRIPRDSKLWRTPATSQESVRPIVSQVDYADKPERGRAPISKDRSGREAWKVGVSVSPPKRLPKPPSVPVALEKAQLWLLQPPRTGGRSNDSQKPWLTSLRS
jgi:hypothetical protein